MTEPSTIIQPIDPDASVQVSAVRYAAVALAAIALVGLVVWYVTSGNETRLESAAAITRASELQRSLFREEGGRLYVSVPAAGALETNTAAQQPSPGEFVRRYDAPTIVASLPPPEQKAQQPPTDEPAPTPPAPDAASPHEPTPAPSASDEPFEPTPAPSPSHEPSDSAAVEHARGESAMDEPTANMSDEMDDSASSEPALDEPMSDDSTSDESMSDDSMLDEPDESDDSSTDD